MRFALPPTLGLKHLLDAFLRLLTETDTTLAEFSSSSTLIAIGLVLALPATMLETGIPLFRLMLDVMPEHPWWSGAFIALGVFQSVANIKRNLHGRRIAAFLGFLAFGFLGALGTISTAPVLILGVVFGVHSLVQGLTYLKLGVHYA